MQELEIEYLKIGDLKPWERNARTHSRAQKRRVAKSIETSGFNNPVLTDENGRILAGHCRVEAAKMLGMMEVPCVRLEHMNPAQKRAYVIADNKLALDAGWDEEILAQEHKFLLEEFPEFDIELTGFSISEIDTLVEGLAPEEPGDPRDDALPAEGKVHSRCQPGDLWQMGRHRLLCGDARDSAAMTLVMDGALARMVFTDPPYNVPIDGNVGGSGKTRHREFTMASGEMSTAEFTDFLRKPMELMAEHSHVGAIHYICMDWRHMTEILAAGETVYSELKNLIVWVKDNGGMGTFYRSRHELIFAFKLGNAPHINTFELGQHGRYRTNVWQYKGVNSFKAGRMEELEMHPTVKPVQMIADAIRDVSGRGDIVLDPFAGSGSTLIAAEKTGRCARLIEIDPIYCDRILARWETFARDDAQLVACGIDRNELWQEAAQ